jgi:hypothetical protein
MHTGFLQNQLLLGLEVRVGFSKFRFADLTGVGERLLIRTETRLYSIGQMSPHR